MAQTNLTTREDVEGAETKVYLLENSLYLCLATTNITLHNLQNNMNASEKVQNDVGSNCKISYLGYDLLHLVVLFTH